MCNISKIDLFVPQNPFLILVFLIRGILLVKILDGDPNMLQNMINLRIPSVCESNDYIFLKF